MAYQIFGWIRHADTKPLFGGKTFSSFEEAWEFIYQADPTDDETDGYYDDYYVEEIA
jgi:hypothetical protein